MHGNIECAFIGRLGQEADIKTSAAGNPWTRLSLAVGQGDDTQWVSVAVFGEAAERLCAGLRKGDRVYVEGTLRLAEWAGRDGHRRASLSVAAWKAEKLGAIGRNRPARIKAGRSEGGEDESRHRQPAAYAAPDAPDGLHDAQIPF